MTTTYSKTIAERDAALHEDMKRAINVVKKTANQRNDGGIIQVLNPLIRDSLL